MVFNKMIRCVFVFEYYKSKFNNSYKLQSNLSIADMLYNGHLVIADTFLRNRLNHGETLIEKPLYSGHFYSGHLL